MKVGFAGSGNMAGAIARGWALAGGPETMLFTDSGSGRAQALADEVGGQRVEGLAALAGGSDAVVLAVKPGALNAAAEGLAGFSGPLISLLGATTVESLAAAFPQAAVLRTMPNVGVELAQGTICHVPPADPEALAPALEVLARIAELVELPEAQIDAATTVMGCSPAWLTVAAQAIADEGAAAGLDPELAKRLIARTTAVTGELLLSREAPEIRRVVASPGGSTEAGLDELANRNAGGAYAGAVRAALERMEGKR
jgi:pyrroline-5-carboxylate reductase